MDRLKKMTGNMNFFIAKKEHENNTA